MIRRKIQYFDWGQIEWIIEPNNMYPSSIMSVGIATNLPGKTQAEHVHYADEQLFYILSGEGEHRINGKLIKEEPGSIHHIRAGSRHELVHVGNEPLVKLLVSIPVAYEQNIPFQNNEIDFNSEGIKFDDNIKISKQDIEKIYNEIICPLKMPVTIMDADEQIVINGENYPDICKRTCNIDIGVKNCSLYNIGYNYGLYKEPISFRCPYGLSVFALPIIINNEVIGLIKGGHVKEPGNGKITNDAGIKNNANDIQYETPRSTVNAILQILKSLSSNIANYYVFKNTVIELSKKEEIIKDISNNKFVLESSLRTTKERILSIQINNHFLFNTLNSIASLALEEDSHRIYSSIISLSKMFRYLLKNKDYLVQLKDEINFIKEYAELQKIRFKDRLDIKFDISDEAQNRHIPFNCLQPIIENSFKHGFGSNDIKMCINVYAGIKEDKLFLKVCDNGVGMGKELLRTIDSQIKENIDFESNGLKMIYSKLQYFYGSHFDFKIDSEPGMGVSVSMVLPEKTA